MSFKDGRSEMNHRTTLKTSVDRCLSSATPATVCICDSINYIRGFRYELYCLARQYSTQCCVVWVTCSEETAVAHLRTHPHPLPDALSVCRSIGRVGARIEQCDEKGVGTHRYRFSVSRCAAIPLSFEDLWSRFEEPSERNRWERPLFIISTDPAVPSSDGTTLSAIPLSLPGNTDTRPEGRRAPSRGCDARRAKGVPSPASSLLPSAEQVSIRHPFGAGL